MIEEDHGRHAVRTMCAALGVSPSGVLRLALALRVAPARPRTGG